MLGIAVGPYGGGGIPVHPAADLRSGVLHVVVVPDPSTAGAPPLLRATTRELALRLGPDTPVNLDGEPTTTRPTQVHVLPGALHVIQPTDAGR